MGVEELRVLATATDMSEVGIIVGSETDMPVMDFCREVLVENHIEFDNVVASAHRNPYKVQEWTSGAESRGNKVIIAAADTFRAAAVQQLEIWAKRVGAELVSGPEGGDPAGVAFKA